MSDDLDGWIFLHLLGMGGVTAMVIWIGYGVMWLAMKMVEWWDER